MYCCCFLATLLTLEGSLSIPLLSFSPTELNNGSSVRIGQLGVVVSVPWSNFSLMQPKEWSAVGRDGSSEGRSVSRTIGTYSFVRTQPRESEAAAVRSRAGTPDAKVPSTGTRQQNCTCGVRNIASRIVGGQEAEVHEYPWHVALVARGGRQPYCGGSIVSDMFVATAAHCVDENSQSQIAVVVGEHDWTKATDSLVTQQRTIRTVTRHPGYDNQTLDNDLALLELTEPITFLPDNKIAPVCLPQPDDLHEGVPAIVSGWGTLTEGGSQPDVLHEVTVSTLSNAECGATSYPASYITDNMICAGVPEGGKDSCQGDSGGPLVTLGASGSSYELIGVVSWGYGCARENFPGVYTRVAKYVSWIEQETAGSVRCPAAA